MFSNYRSSKLKVNLRLAINRLKLLEKKKTEQAQKARREIADYLANGKTERARIRVEHIIREDYLVEAMELIELYCDLLLARFGLLETTKYCEEGLAEAVCTLIWVAPRLQTDVSELKLIAAQLGFKYGKMFAEQARTNSCACVNDRVIHRLGVDAPSHRLVENYLLEIARSHNITYEPDPSVMLDYSSPRISTTIVTTTPLPSAPSVIDFPPRGPTDYPPPGNNGGGGTPTLVSNASPWVVPQNGPGVDFDSSRTAELPMNGATAPDTRGHSARVPSTVHKGLQENFPVLPSVPDDDLPRVEEDSNDLDFDDLTRRFENLKNRK